MGKKGAPLGNQYAFQEGEGYTISFYLKKRDVLALRRYLDRKGQSSSDADAVKLAKHIMKQELEKFLSVEG